MEDPGVIIQNDLTWEKACLVNVPRSVSSCLRPCIESHDPKTRAVYGGSFQNGLQEFGGSGNIITIHELAPSSNTPRAKPSQISTVLDVCPSNFDGDSFWPGSSSYFRHFFSALHIFFQLDSLQLGPYSSRRGAATHFLQFQNILDFVIIQGRWKINGQPVFPLMMLRLCLSKSKVSCR